MPFSTHVELLDGDGILKFSTPADLSPVNFFMNKFTAVNLFMNKFTAVNLFMNKFTARTVSSRRNVARTP